MTGDAPKPASDKVSLRKQLVRGGVAALVLRVASVAAGLAASVTLARVLGPETYGVYALVFSIITLLGMPVKMGLPTLVLRETARADQDLAGAMMTGIWRWSDRALLIMSTVVLAAASCYLLMFADWQTPRAFALLFALPLIPLIGLAEVKGAAVRGLRHVALGGVANKVVRPVLLTGAVLLAAAVLPDALSAADAFVLHGIAAAIALCLALVILRKVRPDHPGGDAPLMQSRAWIAAIIPLGAIAGLQLISHNTDILMLGALADDADVGFYRVALSGATIAVFGLTVSNLVLQPHFARAWQAQNLRQLQKLASAGARLSMVATLPVLLIFWFGGSDLLIFVFGEAYAGAFAALVLLCLGQAVNAFCGSSGTLLAMSGHEKIVLFGLVISTCVNVGLNWLLIPLYGIEGAAFATGFSMVVWNLIAWMAAWKILRVDCSFIGYPLKPLVAGTTEKI